MENNEEQCECIYGHSSDGHCHYMDCESIPVIKDTHCIFDNAGMLF